MTQSKKIKVLFTLPMLYAGGAERVLISFLNNTDREKYDPVFLSVSEEGELKYLIDPDIPTHTLNRKINLYTLILLYFRIRKINPDIIVSTMVHMNFAILCLRPLFPKKRIIIREAITPDFFFKKYPYKGHIIKALYKILYPMADIILSPSQKIFDEFKNMVGLSSRKFYRLRNPVHFAKLRNPKENLPTYPVDNIVYFIACGRLGYQKGFDRLIKAMAKIEMPFDWRLDIIGEGDKREELEKLIAYNHLEDKIRILGLMRDPSPYFAKADCFLLPSRFEGLPNVVLESLASGTPVIATQEAGGIQEIQAEAREGAVTIVDSMSAFRKKMEKIVPQNKKHFALPLLSSQYDSHRVFRNFNRILWVSQR